MDTAIWEAMVRAGRFSGELLLRLRGGRAARGAALHFLRLTLAEGGCSFVSLEPRVLAQLEQHAARPWITTSQDCGPNTIAFSSGGLTPDFLSVGVLLAFIAPASICCRRLCYFADTRV